MSEDLTFDEVWDIVEKRYYDCFIKTKERFKDVLTEEVPLQSACATIWINVTKEKSSVSAYLNRLNDKIAKTNKEAIPSAVEVWKWHFKEYIDEFGPRITSAIHYYVSQNMSGEEMESHIKDRVYRLRCEKLTPDEQKELAKSMFGDEHDD